MSRSHSLAAMTSIVASAALLVLASVGYTQRQPSRSPKRPGATQVAKPQKSQDLKPVVADSRGRREPVSEIDVQSNGDVRLTTSSGKVVTIQQRQVERAVETAIRENDEPRVYAEVTLRSGQTLTARKIRRVSDTQLRIVDIEGRARTVSTAEIRQFATADLIYGRQDGQVKLVPQIMPDGSIRLVPESKSTGDTPGPAAGSRQPDRGDARSPAPSVPDYFDYFDENASGHNWYNSYLLAIASLYIYPADASDQPVNDSTSAGWQEFRQAFAARLGAMGMKKFDFARNVNSGAACATMSNDDVVIVVFRGSEQAANDWLADFNIALVDVTYGQFSCRLHKGFHDTTATVYSELKSELSGHGSSKKIWITGHSLGGAMAYIAAWRLLHDGFPVRGVHTYAAPRAGTAVWRDFYEGNGPNTQRWVNHLDPVPCFPLFRPIPPFSPANTYRHVGKLNNIDGNETVTLNDSNQFIGPVPANAFHYHDLRNYIQFIYDNMGSNRRPNMPAPNSI